MSSLTFKVNDWRILYLLLAIIYIYGIYIWE